MEINLNSVPPSLSPQSATKDMEFPRGISPAILIDHVKNTTAYIFEDSFIPNAHQPFITNLKNADLALKQHGALELSHSAYYELCLSAHWTTVASFVPTDVDNQIRFRLWYPTLPIEELNSMVVLIKKALSWDTTTLSTRFVTGPKDQNILAGHGGEWFSVAVAAYGATRRRLPEQSEEMRSIILAELSRQADVFNQFRACKDGIGSLKAATTIAHNLGDLIRVMDMWQFEPDDLLRTEVEKLKLPDALNGALHIMALLNTQYMAVENHRHFALRKPKILRKSSDFLIPIGPFYDEWGSRIAKHPLISEEELGDIAEALVDGWVYLENSVGYARALSGIENSIKGGLTQLCKLVPKRIAKTLTTGKLRTQISVSRERFESQWNQFGLKF